MGRRSRCTHLTGTKSLPESNVVRQAVILAAGRGSRLGPITEQLPKALVAVAGRPVLARILDGLIRARIERFIVVTGYRGEMIESEFGNGTGSGVSIEYVRQQQLDGTARALQLSRPNLDDERFVFAWADVVVEPDNYQAVIRASRFADGAIAVNHMDDPAAGAAVLTEPTIPWPRSDDSAAAFATSIIEKPAPGTHRSHWNNAGFGVLSPAIWPAIEQLQPSSRGEYELPAAVDSIIQNGARIRAVPVRGAWFDIGTPQALSEASEAFQQ